MIPNDEPLRSQTITRMIEYIIRSSDTLNKWEQDFVDSIHEQHLDGKRLSTKQCEILERIYDGV